MCHTKPLVFLADDVQLEQTVAKLQIAYNISHEEMAALPPPSRRFQQLAEENARLTRDNSELRAALADYEAGRTPSVVPPQQTSATILGAGPERKKRRLEETGLYIFTVRLLGCQRPSLLD